MTKRMIPWRTIVDTRRYPEPATIAFVVVPDGSS